MEMYLYLRECEAFMFASLFVTKDPPKIDTGVLRYKSFAIIVDGPNIATGLSNTFIRSLIEEKVLFIKLVAVIIKAEASSLTNL